MGPHSPPGHGRSGWGKGGGMAEGVRGPDHEQGHIKGGRDFGSFLGSGLRPALHAGEDGLARWL